MPIKISEVTGVKIHNKETGESFDFNEDVQDMSVASDTNCVVPECTVQMNEPSEITITLTTKTTLAVCAVLVGAECPNKTVVHHMKHGSLRVRKKNYQRMLKTMIKEWRND